MRKHFSSFIIAIFTVMTVQAQDNWKVLPAAQTPVIPRLSLDIRNYGAKPDAFVLNTKSIQSCIDACAAKGGGRVVIPPGLWVTGPIVLRSAIDLHLQEGAVLSFSKDFDQYPLVEGNWEGKATARCQAPIGGTGLQDVMISGKGIIDGNGDVWRMVGKDRLTENEWKAKVASGGLVSADGKLWYPSAKTKKAHEERLNGNLQPGSKLSDFEAIKDYLRPNLVVLTQCKRVMLTGITFRNSPAWCLHPLMCEDLTVLDVQVRNPEYAQNGDGIDIESCRNVLIKNSVFDCGDDGICIKSGRDEAGRKRGMPTENMLIENCTVYHGHGGFVVGSEMSGGARNIWVQDCSFIGTEKGIRFKTTRGRGGVVENIHIRNIAMKDIEREAIFFDMYYFVPAPKPGESVPEIKVDETTPIFRNVEIENIVCEGAKQAIFLRGLPEMKVTGIRMNNLSILSDTGIEITDAAQITITNAHVQPKNSSELIKTVRSSDITLNGKPI